MTSTTTPAPDALTATSWGSTPGSGSKVHAVRTLGGLIFQACNGRHIRPASYFDRSDVAVTDTVVCSSCRKAILSGRVVFA